MLQFFKSLIGALPVWVQIVCGAVFLVLFFVGLAKGGKITVMPVLIGALFLSAIVTALSTNNTGTKKKDRDAQVQGRAIDEKKQQDLSRGLREAIELANADPMRMASTRRADGVDNTSPRATPEIFAEYEKAIKPLLEELLRTEAAVRVGVEADEMRRYVQTLEYEKGRASREVLALSKRTNTLFVPVDSQLELQAAAHAYFMANAEMKDEHRDLLTVSEDARDLANQRLRETNRQAQEKAVAARIKYMREASEHIRQARELMRDRR